MGLKKRNIVEKILLFCLIVIAIIGINLSKSSRLTSKNINELLQTDAYSYLSPKVINYIKDYYDKTGIVLLTEKNKQNNTPYLNPSYIEYLDSNDNSSNNEEVIPNVTITDFSLPNGNGQQTFSTQNADISVDNLPSSFDLRNVDGKNYVTPLKDQGSEGLCWAYATNSYLESILLIKEGKTYDFSEHQLGYATASDGIKDNKKLFNGFYKLFDGNNFENTFNTLLNNFGFVSQEWDDLYQEEIKNKSKLDASDVYNYDNSPYQVDETIKFSYLDFDKATEEEKTFYMNSIKKQIMHGGTFISLNASPGRGCGLKTDNGYVAYNNGFCNGSAGEGIAGHALHTIGWDDNYTYSFCTSDDKSIYSNTSQCDNNHLISGKGVWILKNSWGEASEAAYVYVPYSSKEIYHSAIKSLSKKDWDNFYNYSYNDISYINNDYSFKEKLNKLKINLTSPNTEYTIYLTDNENPVVDDAAILIGKIITDYAGYYSIDLKDKNLVLDANKYKVMISCDYYNPFNQTTTNLTFFQNAIIYTNNLTDEINTYSADLKYEPVLESSYNFILKSYIHGVTNNSKIDYILKDSNGNQISSNYTIKDNVVFANRVYADLQINKDLQKGEYTIEVNYNNQKIGSSKLVIDTDFVETLGSGTDNNPWQIGTPVQLNLIRQNPNDSFILINDIDLTYDTTNPNGLFYNNGLGWLPILSFEGYLNGQNYKIIGMNIIRNIDDKHINDGTYDEGYSDAGLFNSIGFSDCKLDKCGISNLHFYDTYIDGNFNTAGALAASFGASHYTIIENVSVENGFIRNKPINDSPFYGGLSGGIIGTMQPILFFREGSPPESEIQLNSLYNGATVIGKVAGGIIGSYTNYEDDSSHFNLTNVENTGNIQGKNMASGVIGNIYINGTKVEWNNEINNFSNTINVGKISGDGCTSNYFCVQKETLGSENLTEKINMTNLYGIMDKNYDLGNNRYEVQENNVKVYTAKEMKDSTLYSNWPNFDEYWQKSENIMPIIKNVYFIYTTVKDIVMNVNDKVILKNYINPSDRINNAIININNNGIIKYDENSGTIEALKEGSTSIDILVNTDGYSGKINVKVMDDFKIDSESKKIFLANSMSLKKYKDSSGLAVKIYDNSGNELNDNDNVGTGYKTEIYENGQLIDEYINVLYGDVNGDAKVDISDVAKIYSNVMQVLNADELINLAADLNGDNLVDISDVAFIYNKIMKG